MEEFKHIKVSVECHKADAPPTYRIYVDNDLITERTFGWPGYKNYIRENLICNLEPGIHQLVIENPTMQGYFELKDFELNGDTNCVISKEADPSFTGRIITFQVN